MEFSSIENVKEPQLTFEAFTPNPYHIHPLDGLIEFGPYSQKLTPMHQIRIAVICPKSSFHIVYNLYIELLNRHVPKERASYLRDFPGFNDVFRSNLVLLDEKESVQIDGLRILESPNNQYIKLSQELGNAVRSISQRKQDFDVLFIYLPESWKEGFFDAESSFDLHDFLKATTATYNIPTQILRESSVINYKCRCSVSWRLSIALYVKAGGVPWKLSTMDEETAFVGLSYSSRYNEQTERFDFTTCCSQVFDSDGTGLEFIAYDTGEVEFRVGENPFLTRAEMRKVMSKTLALYQKRHAGRSPKTLVVHKTSHFTSNEIDGVFDAIPSHINVELLQIVESSSWRGVKYMNNGKAIPDNYPVSRGSFIQTGAQEVMLWTQGNVVLNGKNYFKEGKNIPAPIILRRFAGNGGWSQNCLAIIGLTKMNWNHDALYNRLPVTLEYAKVLATTIKRMTSMVNKPYEFRYFM